MEKRIIYTVLLVLFMGASFWIGFKPFGPIAAWQNQNTKTEIADVTEEEQEDEDKDQKKTWITLQESLTNKSEQTLKVWSASKSVRDAVNTLQSADARAVFIAVDPLQALAPFDKSLGRISGFLMFAYSFLVFEKMLLAISVTVIFMILIPVCASIAISALWLNGKKGKLRSEYKIFIASVLICLVLPFTLPASFALPKLLEDTVLSTDVGNLVSSIEEYEQSAVNLDSEIRGLRRVGVTIMDYVSSAKEITNDIVKDSMNYFIIFIVINIFIPVLTIFGIYKLLRYVIKLIL